MKKNKGNKKESSFELYTIRKVSISTILMAEKRNSALPCWQTSTVPQESDIWHC